MSFADRLIDRASQRRPDFIIGGEDDPYLYRWHLIPRNRFFNCYLHLFLRSDDDRALHDHPYSNASILLRGRYTEHLAANDVRFREAGDVVVRLRGSMQHRIQLDRPAPNFTEAPCWSLFITGPRYREWGFACDRGWVHHELFTSPTNKGEVGRGCDQ